MNRSMNGGQPAFDRVPATADPTRRLRQVPTLDLRQLASRSPDLIIGVGFVVVGLLLSVFAVRSS